MRIVLKPCEVFSAKYFKGGGVEVSGSCPVACCRNRVQEVNWQRKTEQVGSFSLGPRPSHPSVCRLQYCK